MALHVHEQTAVAEEVCAQQGTANVGDDETLSVGAQVDIEGHGTRAEGADRSFISRIERGVRPRRPQVGLSDWIHANLAPVSIRKDIRMFLTDGREGKTGMQVNGRPPLSLVEADQSVSRVAAQGSALGRVLAKPGAIETETAVVGLEVGVLVPQCDVDTVPQTDYTTNNLMASLAQLPYIFTCLLESPEVLIGPHVARVSMVFIYNLILIIIINI